MNADTESNGDYPPRPLASVSPGRVVFCVGLLVGFSLFIAATIGIPSSGSAAEEDRVTLSLHSNAKVSGNLVRVEDVATFSGGTLALRKKIGAIDLEEFSPFQKGTLVISTKQISYRLQLAGVNSELFQIKGTTSVQVTRLPPNLTEASVLAAARKELEQRLPWPLADVDIRLVRPVPVAPVKMGPTDNLCLEANFPPEKNILGRVKINVTVYLNDYQHSILPVEFDVRLYQELAVAVRHIEKGEVLTEKDLHADRRVVEDPSRYLPYLACLSDQRARKSILPGQVLGPEDVEPSTEKNPVLIRPADQVKLIAEIGALRVEASGEALQQGRSGDWIWVRNNSSKIVIKGRVLEAGVVEVKN